MEILIIESETYLAASLAHKLGADGHNCTIKAANASADGEFDVVLLGTFFDTLKIIKEHKNSIIIILANYINSDITQALKEGASDYILKPVIIEELRRKIDFFTKFRKMQSLSASYESILGWNSATLGLDEKVLNKLRLPLQINLASELNADLFVFSLAKARNLGFLRLDDAKQIVSNSQEILYFWNFDKLSTKEQDEILSMENKKIIIRTAKNLAGFSTYEIESRSNLSLMSVDEYIKFCISEQQENYNDTQLAQILGISRKSLWEKRRRYGIAKKK